VHKNPMHGEINRRRHSFRRSVRRRYARTKLESEQVALDLSRERGPCIVVIRPTIIYGPRSGNGPWAWQGGFSRSQFAWSRRLAGRANLVHVDDVVEGILLAAVVPEAAASLHHCI